eukprot:gb/GECH01009664.1/.p1 GENE.gb/GECH01009664.1/~~gb/GECH01009664.1/.p1  ORF type:complete len:518 (+),score=75.68 gb/GECH01009664.1/:1-1554(+)
MAELNGDDLANVFEYIPLENVIFQARRVNSLWNESLFRMKYLDFDGSDQFNMEAYMENGIFNLIIEEQNNSDVLLSDLFHDFLDKFTYVNTLRLSFMGSLISMNRLCNFIQSSSARNLKKLVLCNLPHLKENFSLHSNSIEIIHLNAIDEGIILNSAHLPNLQYMYVEPTFYSHSFQGLNDIIKSAQQLKSIEINIHSRFKDKSSKSGQIQLSRERDFLQSKAMKSFLDSISNLTQLENLKIKFICMEGHYFLDDKECQISICSDYLRTVEIVCSSFINISISSISPHFEYLHIFSVDKLGLNQCRTPYLQTLSLGSLDKLIIKDFPITIKHLSFYSTVPQNKNIFHSLTQLESLSVLGVFEDDVRSISLENCHRLKKIWIDFDSIFLIPSLCSAVFDTVTLCNFYPFSWQQLNSCIDSDPNLWRVHQISKLRLYSCNLFKFSDRQFPNLQYVEEIEAILSHHLFPSHRKDAIKKGLSDHVTYTKQAVCTSLPSLVIRGVTGHVLENSLLFYSQVFI